ncbi:MAG: AbrB family transcriptional regulator, partial [Alphaproteobacteria bacterium]|nr:AbrB family transcriptional regulator [Alphaproteobacteria bacterium]
LGMMIGGAFSPDILAKAGRWWISIAGMAVFVAGVGAMIYVYYVRVTGLDRRTALFASLPGGLNEMAVMGADMGADDRMISLAHSVRIFIVVMTIPFLFQALGWYERGASAYSVIVLADVQTVAVIKIVGGSLAGMAVCRLVRFPSPVLIGAMLGSAAVHITGWTDAQLPTIFITLSQIVIGSAIGARFAGLTGKMVWRGIRHAAGSSAMMLVAAFAATVALAPLVGLAFAPVLLAFAPGGFAEMILIALALNVDTAYVSTHHLFRIFLIVLAVPALFRMMAWFGIRKEAAKRVR